MAIKGLSLIVSRNDFYYRNYRHMASLFALLLLITLFLIGFYYYQRNQFVATTKYFPTTPDGRLIAMPPVNINHLLLSEQKVSPNSDVIVGMPEPVQTYTQLEPEGEDALVKYWANLAVKDMFDYDYVHYRAEIQDSSKYFTAVGHQRFITALISSRNLETVRTRRAIVIPEITGPVKIMHTRMFEGHYVWDMEVPVKLTYESAAFPNPIIQTLLARMSVARVSTLRSPFYGLAIYQLNFEQVFNQGG